MTEWIMIFIFAWYPSPGYTADPSSFVIQGFTSKEACEKAYIKIFESTASLMGNMRLSFDVPKNLSSDVGSMTRYECVEIQK